MRTLAPWTGTGLKREVDRLFDRFFDSPWAETPALGDWTPAIDVTEGKDAVTAEYRGSSMIERFIDPNDPDLDSTWDSDTINLSATGKADLSRFYKFRVISTKKFAP